MPVALSTAPRGAEKREESARTGSYDPAASAWTLALGDAMRICARMLIALLSHEAVPQLDSGVTGTRFASAVSCVVRVCYSATAHRVRRTLYRGRESGAPEPVTLPETWLQSSACKSCHNRVLKTDKITWFS
jgi:hypothetical protein